MKLSLKQARRAETALEGIINEMLHNLRGVNHQTLAKKALAISEGTAEIRRIQEQVMGCIGLRQRIRDSIAKANFEGGVDEKIALIALRTRELDVVDAMLSCASEATDKYVNGSYVTVYRQGFSKEEIEDLKVYRRKANLAITALKDSTMGANNNTFIELSENDAQHLVELGLA